jgi:hypothetical protein
MKHFRIRLVCILATLSWMFAFGNIEQTFGGQPVIFTVGGATLAQGLGMQDSWVHWVSPDGSTMLVDYRSDWPASIYLTFRDPNTDSWGPRQQVLYGFTSASVGPDGYLYAREDVQYSKIVRCAPTGILQWGAPVNLGLTVPPHQNSQTFDGQSLYYAGSPSGGDGFDLYVSLYDAESGTFQEGARVDSLSDASAEEFSPWISSDGLTMLFASTRAGGYGGYDIYSATRTLTDSTAWENICNLGPSVNTAADEFDPAYATELGMLYFDRGGGSAYQIHVIPEPSIMTLTAVCLLAFFVRRSVAVIRH